MRSGIGGGKGDDFLLARVYNLERAFFVWAIFGAAGRERGSAKMCRAVNL